MALDPLLECAKQLLNWVEMRAVRRQENGQGTNVGTIRVNRCLVVYRAVVKDEHRVGPGERVELGQLRAA